MPAPTVTPEAALLADALDLEESQLAPIGREPLGEGTVAGFRLPGEAEAYAYVDTSLLPVREETGLALEGVARIWMHPADPHLPALAPVAFGEALSILLARLGVHSGGTPVLVAYRPGRRAVVRAAGDGEPVWVKVVRPRRVERIVELHTAFRSAGLPVPGVTGWAPDGILVTAHASGTPAIDAAATGALAPELLLDRVDELRARIAAAPFEGSARTSIATRRGWYESRLRGIDTGIDVLLDEIPRDGGPTTSASVGVHGDLHLGQIFVDAGGQVTGLIDVDTAGVGHPADDVAAFLGHTIASATLSGADASTALWDVADAAAARWRDVPDSAPLSAAHLIGHALAAVDAGDRARARGLLRVAAALCDGRGEHKGALMNAFELA
ncbi:phosphotransferase [Microbacterium oleivorans]|uniref:phosphotransferase n=1 Tax=Microbacterium oleivorans TaxID=273677 RepID=UPI00203A4EE0|nr:phosphotransferase [Microbacterium oleivorans]MCM3695564.1 phosphotransferase [Microbacterium oleivorans]